MHKSKVILTPTPFLEIWGIGGDLLPLWHLVVSALCGGLAYFGIPIKQSGALGGRLVV